ncbi:MAG: hypothetical protein JXO22_07930 [Phycisphaerae bacterium]|nr:hypothetical protein [Phycisphaerae bacterium]
MNSAAGCFKFLIVAAGCAAMLLAAGGCRRTYSEMLIREGIAGPHAPAWVQGDLKDSQLSDEVFFVGRSVAYNVLDEGAAVAAAREDVYRQIASLISTRVTSRANNSDRRVNTETAFTQRMQGPWPAGDAYDGSLRFLPGPELQQAIAREAWLFTSCVAGDLLDRGVWWEQWDVREVHDGLGDRAETEEEQRAGVYGRANGLVRYKCWVRMSIPREKLEGRIREFQRYVTDAYKRYLDDRERAVTWAEEDRDLRIQREEDARQWMRVDQVEDRTEARELRRIMGIDRVRYSVTRD